MTASQPTWAARHDRQEITARSGPSEHHRRPAFRRRPAQSKSCPKPASPVTGGTSPGPHPDCGTAAWADAAFPARVSAVGYGCPETRETTADPVAGRRGVRLAMPHCSASSRQPRCPVVRTVRHAGLKKITARSVGTRNTGHVVPPQPSQSNPSTASVGQPPPEWLPAHEPDPLGAGDLFGERFLLRFRPVCIRDGLGVRAKGTR
jgi:hypothetical protein